MRQVYIFIIILSLILVPIFKPNSFRNSINYYAKTTFIIWQKTINFIKEYKIHYIILTIFGAAGGPLFSKETGKTLDAKQFIKSILPGRSDHFYNLTNAITLSLYCGLVTFIVLQPENAKNSLICGLSGRTILTKLMNIKLQTN